MSKAGAVALANANRYMEAADAVERDGLRMAAATAAEERSESAKAKAISDLPRLLSALGIYDAEPFILDRFHSFTPEQRVCVQVDEVVLNYVAASDKQGSQLQVILGACKCGLEPYRVRVASLADVGVAISGVHAPFVMAYRCKNCPTPVEVRGKWGK